VYLDPRPAVSELGRIYPPEYHAFNFDAEHFGLVYRVRARLEARRLLAALEGLPISAHVLDVGCGDGFHLDLLRQYGPLQWHLFGVDIDSRAVTAASSKELNVHQGSVLDLDLPADFFDAVLLIATIEHVADAPAVLRSVRRLLRAGGRVVVVTDNTDSLDFRLAKRRYWGGYHFPRHWNLFNRRSLTLLAEQSGFKVRSMRTLVSPVNWTYSVRNALDDLGAPPWLVRRFTLGSPVALAAFTVFDLVHKLAGRGALLQAVLVKP
jgi:SAM-dependent methyltransferase